MVINNLSLQPGATRHTISVLVENRPGVLARVSSLFARRSFNIDSLSVSPTEREDISRITVTAMVKQLLLSKLLSNSISFCMFSRLWNSTQTTQLSANSC